MAALTVRALRVQLGERATPVEKTAARLFVSEVRRRTGLRIQISDRGKQENVLILGTPESAAEVQAFCEQHAAAAELSAEGFCLSTKPVLGKLYVVARSPSGVVAGVGRLLRLCRYEEGAVVIPELTLSEAPRLPIRGMYFATHFYNFYHVAPVEEVDPIIEDLALWGGNSLTVCFDMHHFNGLEDPAAQRHLARLKHFGEIAHGLGMQFGLGMASNWGYPNSPKELRAKPVPAADGSELCPSNPEGLALIGKLQAEVLDAFPRVDFIWAWAHDAGGCGCEQCAPWGGNGHLKASEQLARLFHARFPKGKVWTSTWVYDHFVKGEYDALFNYLQEKQPAWLEGILHGWADLKDYERVLHRPLPERFPLADFPEISMTGMFPWGGWGANPLPAHSAVLFEGLRDKTVGGWCYSEGIYEDLNKFLWIQHFWNPDRSADDILREYAAYYFGPDCADDAVHLFNLLEKTHRRSLWNIANLAQADEAWELAQKIDAHLPPWAKTSWRWRLVYVRAKFDHLLAHHGHVSPQARRLIAPLLDELNHIYHVQAETHEWVRPLPIADQPKLAEQNAGNLAFNRPVRASSVSAGAHSIGAEWALVDGWLAEGGPPKAFGFDTVPFWASDPARDRTPEITIDLGEKKPMKEARLQFRGIQGKFMFVPSSLALAVSDDGARFETVLNSSEVPKEGAPYSAGLWSYPINRRARFLRITLGPSQHAAAPYAGLVELVEIQVFGP